MFHAAPNESKLANAMIHFNLTCNNEHEFEGWFQSGAAFDAQVKKGQVTCPVCDVAAVRKAPMAPAVSPKGGRTPRAGDTGAQAANLHGKLRELRAAVEKNCENVGDKFADEARKIHYGETQARGIYGNTSNDEARELRDEGVPFARIPWTKREDA